MKLDFLRQCARPVVFDTGIAEAPFSIAGTAFLVGFGRSVFVLTARHVIRDWPIHQLMVFPSDQTTQPLRLPMWWRLEDGNGNDDADGTDLLVIQADLKGIPKTVRRSSHLLHLNPPKAAEWFPDRFNSIFFLFGYPLATNEVDYARSQINTQQIFLCGHYVGQSISSGCHEIHVHNSLYLPDFNGFSGSPVFSLRAGIGQVAQPTFCGLALRGSTSSRRIHFLGASTILLALREAIED